MDPAVLAAAVAAADRQLAPDDGFPDADLQPRPDGVAVGARLVRPQRDPASHGKRHLRAPGADVAPEPHRRVHVHLDEVEEPVQVEVGERRPASAVEAEDPRGVGRLAERPVGPAEEQVAGVHRRVVGLCAHVALRDEEVREPVVVDVGELGMPGRGREHVAAGEWLRGVDAAPQGDVPEGRLLRPHGQRLELVVALAGEVVLGVAVAGQVLAGDPHPPDLHRDPAVVGGVGAWRHAPVDPPELVRAVDVVVAVIRHAEVALSRAVPVAEEDGQGAVAGGEGRGRAVGGRARVRHEELVGGAVEGRRAGRVDGQVVADGERREAGGAVPSGGERGRPGAPPAEAPGLVRPLEAAVAAAAEEDVLPDPEDGEVDEPVAVDVERVGGSDVGEVGGGVREAREAERASGRTVVAEEGRPVAAAGDEDVGAPVGIAVEDGDAAAGVEGDAAAVRVVEAGRRRLLDEAGRAERGGRGHPAPGDQDVAADRSAREHDDRGAEADRRPSPHRVRGPRPGSWRGRRPSASLTSPPCHRSTAGPAPTRPCRRPTRSAAR